VKLLLREGGVKRLRVVVNLCVSKFHYLFLLFMFILLVISSSRNIHYSMLWYGHK
jgi:hypothetical protein